MATAQLDRAPTARNRISETPSERPSRDLPPLSPTGEGVKCPNCGITKPVDKPCPNCKQG